MGEIGKIWENTAEKPILTDFGFQLLIVQIKFCHKFVIYSLTQTVESIFRNICLYFFSIHYVFLLY